MIILSQTAKYPLNALDTAFLEELLQPLWTFDAFYFQEIDFVPLTQKIPIVLVDEIVMDRLAKDLDVERWLKDNDYEIEVPLKLRDAKMPPTETLGIYTRGKLGVFDNVPLIYVSPEKIKKITSTKEEFLFLLAKVVLHEFAHAFMDRNNENVSVKRRLFSEWVEEAMANMFVLHYIEKRIHWLGMQKVYESSSTLVTYLKMLEFVREFMKRQPFHYRLGLDFMDRLEIYHLLQWVEYKQKEPKFWDEKRFVHYVVNHFDNLKSLSKLFANIVSEPIYQIVDLSGVDRRLWPKRVENFDLGGVVFIYEQGKIVGFVDRKLYIAKEGGIEIDLKKFPNFTNLPTPLGRRLKMRLQRLGCEVYDLVSKEKKRKSGKYFVLTLSKERWQRVRRSNVKRVLRVVGENDFTVGDEGFIRILDGSVETSQIVAHVRIEKVIACFMECDLVLEVLLDCSESPVVANEVVGCLEEPEKLLLHSSFEIDEIEYKMLLRLLRRECKKVLHFAINFLKFNLKNEIIGKWLLIGNPKKKDGWPDWEQDIERGESIWIFEGRSAKDLEKLMKSGLKEGDQAFFKLSLGGKNRSKIVAKGEIEKIQRKGHGYEMVLKILEDYRDKNITLNNFKANEELLKKLERLAIVVGLTSSEWKTIEKVIDSERNKRK